MASIFLFSSVCFAPREYAHAFLLAWFVRCCCCEHVAFLRRSPDVTDIAHLPSALSPPSPPPPPPSPRVFLQWIGFEVGLLNDQLDRLGIPWEGYMAFLHSVPFSYYQILMIAWQLITALLGREFGPMLRCERRAQCEHRIRNKECPVFTDSTMEPKEVRVLGGLGRTNKTEVD